MEKYFLIVPLMAVLTLYARAQKAHSGTAATWEKEGGNYEVNCKQKGKAISYAINPKGSILETETDMAVNELPLAIRNYVKQHYKGGALKKRPA